MNKKKPVCLIIIFVLTVILTASAVILTAIHFYRVNRNVTLPDSTYDTASDSLILANNPIDFASLKAENADVCGWVSIEGCGVLINDTNTK